MFLLVAISPRFIIATATIPITASCRTQRAKGGNSFKKSKEEILLEYSRDFFTSLLIASAREDVLAVPDVAGRDLLAVPDVAGVVLPFAIKLSLFVYE